MKALIFDFDGTTLDTEVPEFQSWQEIYQAHSCELPLATWAKCIGTSVDAFDPYIYLEKQYGRTIDRESIRQRHHHRTVELIAGQVVREGVTEYLAEAKRLGLKLAIASSSGHSWVDTHLARLGLLEYFDVIKCRDDVKRVKPDPELYLATLQALDIQSEEAIVFEDSPNGVLAANRAGIFCVVVPNPMTRDLPLDHANLRLNSLAELPLEKLLLQVQK